MAVNTNQKANSDIAFMQGGNKMLIGGGKTPFIPLEVESRDLQAVLANAGNTLAVGIFDDFLGDAVLSPWAENLSVGATAAINSQAGGAIRLSTDTDDDDFATLALSLSWLVSNGLTVFNARVRCNTAITLRAVEIGVSDALSETAGLAFSSHDATVVAVADDAAIFAINSDESITTWSCLTARANTNVLRTNSAVTPTAGVYQKFTIAIRSDGSVFFLINDALVGSHPANSIATTALLTPWISLKSLSAAAKTIDADYIGMFGERA